MMVSLVCFFGKSPPCSWSKTSCVPLRPIFVLCCTCNFSSPSQELGQRFVDCLEQIQLAQNMVVNHELANWRQSQRMFNWEDDRGKVELNTIQQW